MSGKPRKQRSLYYQLVSIIVLSVLCIFSIYATLTYQSQRQKITVSIQKDATESLTRLTQNITPFIEAYAVNEYDKLVTTEIELKHHYAIVVQDLKLGEIVGQRTSVSGKIHNTAGDIVDYDDTDTSHRSV